MSESYDIHSIPTPALVVDVATTLRNINSLAAYGRSHNLKLRPHTKTHKSVRVGRMQIDAGATGLAIAKPGEALVMAGAADDLLIAYPAFDSFRAPIVAQLAKTKTVRVAVDSLTAIDRLAEAGVAAKSTIGLLVDLDVGFHRTGVQSAARALELAQHATKQRGARLDGVMFFPGHIFLPNDRQAEPLAALSALLNETLSLWAKHGLKADIVSGGSTPTAQTSHYIKHVTEIRPGTYVYYDMNCVVGGWCTMDDCAARMVCTVISDAVPGKCVIDAGSKTLTSDRRFDAPDSAGYGHIVELPNAKLVRLSEEHGEIDLRGEAPPKLGSRLTVIPNHICPCVNLHDQFWFKETDGRLTRSTVEARGKVN